MMVTKKVVITMIIIIFITFGICSAYGLPKGTLAENQLYLGYINIGSTPQKVTSVYGQPNRIDERNGMTYYYGNTLKFSFMGKGDSWLYDITTTDNNGITTADGVAVGMLVSKLYDTYGTPNYTRKDKDATRYWYYWERSSYVYFTFTVKNGKIVQISLHHAD